MLDQRSGRQVPEDFSAGRNTLRFKPTAGDAVSHFRKHLSQILECGGDRLRGAAAILEAYTRETPAGSKERGALVSLGDDS
jgi:hypothetical protein